MVRVVVHPGVRVHEVVQTTAIGVEIEPRASVQPVDAVSGGFSPAEVTGEEIIPIVPVEVVVARLPVQKVVPGVPLEVVVPCTPAELIVPAAAVQVVVARVSVEPVAE